MRRVPSFGEARRVEKIPPPHPNYDELHSAAGEDPAVHAQIEQLKESLNAYEPDPSEVVAHASALRAIPGLEARVATWFELPSTQHWLQVLSNIGL